MPCCCSCFRCGARLLLPPLPQEQQRRGVRAQEQAATKKMPQRESADDYSAVACNHHHRRHHCCCCYCYCCCTVSDCPLDGVLLFAADYCGAWFPDLLLAVHRSHCRCLLEMMMMMVMMLGCDPALDQSDILMIASLCRHRHGRDHDCCCCCCCSVRHHDRHGRLEPPTHRPEKEDSKMQLRKTPAAVVAAQKRMREQQRHRHDRDHDCRRRLLDPDNNARGRRDRDLECCRQTPRCCRTFFLSFFLLTMDSFCTTVCCCVCTTIFFVLFKSRKSENKRSNRHSSNNENQILRERAHERKTKISHTAQHPKYHFPHIHVPIFFFIV